MTKPKLVILQVFILLKAKPAITVLYPTDYIQTKNSTLRLIKKYLLLHEFILINLDIQWKNLHGFDEPKNHLIMEACGETAKKLRCTVCMGG